MHTQSALSLCHDIIVTLNDKSGPLYLPMAYRSINFKNSFCVHIYSMNVLYFGIRYCINYCRYIFYINTTGENKC